MIDPEDSMAISFEEAAIARGIVQSHMDKIRPDRTRPQPDSERPKRIDWGRAARLLAEGNDIQRVANRLGCKPDVIRRNLRRSRKFRLRIESEHAYCRLSAQLKFGTLGDYAIAQMQLRADKLDHRMLQWLGDRIGLNQLGAAQAAGLAAQVEAAMRPGQAAPAAQKRGKAEPGVIDAAKLAEMIRECDEWEAQREAEKAAAREAAGLPPLKTAKFDDDDDDF